MIEKIRPELDIDIGSGEKGLDRIGERTMATLDGSVLMRSVGTSRDKGCIHMW